MTMIPDSLATAQARSPDWQATLSRGFRRLDALLDYLQLHPDQLDLDTNPDFPLRVTRYYASLIEKGRPDDPLLRQVLPDAREWLESPGFCRDPVGDRAAETVPGLIHKYPGRALLTLTGACAIHCRYCFRRHFDYAASTPDIEGPVFDYLQQHPEIHELILSGGDPLSWPNKRLAALVERLNHLPGLRRLRLHSRLISVLPERADAGLIALLKRFRGPVILVHHINHPREISDGNAAAFAALERGGIRQYNQSVLLRGVNDQAGLLADLSFKLFDHGIQPYYLHRLDRVQGAGHFELSEEQCCRVYRALSERLPGYLLPRLVSEIPGRKYKTPAHCG